MNILRMSHRALTQVYGTIPMLMMYSPRVGWIMLLITSTGQSSSNGGPTVPLTNCLLLTWSGIYDAAAERFFAARCSLADGDPTAAARFEGAAAARQMHDLLRRLP